MSGYKPPPNGKRYFDGNIQPLVSPGSSLIYLLH